MSELKARSYLEFIKSVLVNFNFLVKEYKFKCTYKDDYHVQFESKYFYIDIYHERVSFEIYMKIIYKKSLESISLEDMLDYKEISNVKTEFMSSNKDDIFMCINIISQTFKKYAIEFLFDYPEKFDELLCFTKNKKKLIIQEYSTRTLIDKGNHAWENHDFQQIIDLFSSKLNELPELQRKRYNYAKRQISK